MATPRCSARRSAADRASAGSSCDGLREDLADEVVAALGDGQGDAAGGRLVHLRRSATAACLVGRSLVPGLQQSRADQLVEVKRGQAARDVLRVGGFLPGHRVVLAADVVIQRPSYLVDERGHRLPGGPCHAGSLSPAHLVEIYRRRHGRAAAAPGSDRPPRPSGPQSGCRRVAFRRDDAIREEVSGCRRRCRFRPAMASPTPTSHSRTGTAGFRRC